MGLPDRLAALLSIAEQHALLVSRRTVLTSAAAAAASMAIGSPAAAFWRQPDTPSGRNRNRRRAELPAATISL